MHNFHKILVVVLSLQIFLFITSTSAEKTPLSPPVPSKTNNTTNNATNNNHQDVSSKTEILTEAGGQISAAMKPGLPNVHTRGREGEMEPILINKNVSSAAGVTLNISTSPKVQIEGSSPTANVSTTSTTERSLVPIYEDKPPITDNKTSNHKTVSARKGVNYTDFVEHQAKLNASTVKPKPKKPTVTTANDEPYAPSHFQPLSKSNSSGSQSIPKVPNFDMLNESDQGKTQKYVVPIVIIILSVPFVAILISILYKRGSEWWKYRHYRRMDFLINGMYDN